MAHVGRVLLPSEEQLVATHKRFWGIVIRTIAAVILFLIPFAFTRSLGTFGILVAVTVGAPLSILAFVARRCELIVITRSYAFALTGALVGSALAPKVNADPGDAVAAISAGAIIGWLVAAIRNQISW